MTAALELLVEEAEVEAEVDAEEAETADERRHHLATDNTEARQLQMMRTNLSWGGDVGLLAAIASTSALTADALPW